MLAQALRERTISERIRMILSFTKETNANLLSTDHIQIAEWLAKKRTASTKWSYYRNFKAFFHWLEITERRIDNPLKKLPAPRCPKSTPRPIDSVHIRTVLLGRLHLRTRAMILLAAFAGLRVHEIAKIHSRDFDPATGTLYIEGKGGKTAICPLHADLVEFLKRAMPRTGYWFPSYKYPGTHIKGRSVGRVISDAFERKGIEMTAHQLRHSFGTDLVAAGIDIRVVQVLMRHESIQSTAIYVGITEAQQQKAINVLSIPFSSET